MASNLTVDTLSKGATTHNVDEIINKNSPQTALAWAHFDGNNTGTIMSSYGVSSITDLSVGNYRGNFTTAMPDGNYSAFVSAQGGGSAEPDGWNTAYIQMTIRSNVTGSAVDQGHCAFIIYDN